MPRLKVLLRPRRWKLEALVGIGVILAAMVVFEWAGLDAVVRVATIVLVGINLVVLSRLWRWLSVLYRQTGKRDARGRPPVEANVGTRPRALDSEVDWHNSPASAEAAPAAPAAVSIKNLENGIGAGYRTAGYPRLKALATSPDATPVLQGDAWAAIARLRYEENDLSGALEAVVAARNAHGPKGQKQSVTLLYASVLTELGRANEARRLLKAGAPLTANETLRLFNTLSEDGQQRKPERIVEEQLALLNGVLTRGGLAPIGLRAPETSLLLDNLETVVAPRSVVSAKKISVIMPVYNAVATLSTAIQSVTNQTWQNLELIVVDDGSDDGSGELAEEQAIGDSRIKVLRLSGNQGAYAARNAGARIVTGDFVTVHDADDWSHAQKLERQVSPLLEDPSLVGTRSHCIRVKQDREAQKIAIADPTGRPRAQWITPNQSSLLVRRGVIQEVGLWDEVRGGSDAEFVRRVKAHYGDDCVADILPYRPLSFARVLPGSLTNRVETGFQSLRTPRGARRLYIDSADLWHSSSNFRTSLPYDPARDQRPFPTPPAITRDLGPGDKTFDVIILSDFHLPGGTTASNIQEIRALAAAGKRVGLFHHPFSMVAGQRVPRPINSKVWHEVDDDRVKLITLGTKVTCDALVIRQPGTFATPMDDVADISAKHVAIIVNQTPWRTYGGPKDVMYEIGQVNQNVVASLGVIPTWHPISPRVRDALESHHRAELDQVTVADDDWVNIIDVAEWRRPAHQVDRNNLRIGRHSRDARLKWPETAREISSAYPHGDGIEMCVLGGVSSIEQVPGTDVGSWEVHEFDSVTPRDFLHSLDVYVYFTDSRLVEAFGRTLLEALAVGVPVVTMPEFEPLFGDAALYCGPTEVTGVLRTLATDSNLYKEQVRRGHALVEQVYSYEAHLKRMAPYLS